MIIIKVLTLFPELFPGPLGISVTGKALRNKLWELEAINIRDFALDTRPLRKFAYGDAMQGGAEHRTGAYSMLREDSSTAPTQQSAPGVEFPKRSTHKSVDGPPAGGGTGMIMKPDVMSRAIDHAVEQQPQSVFYLSPRGKVLTQAKLHELSKLQSFTLICGRFEGLDQRVIDHYKIEEISIGNYVLTGGELAAYVLIDGCIRLLPGVLGNESSNLEESFAVNSEYQNLVEYPQYTKPNIWNGHKIPEVLVSGNHKKVKEWRLEQARSFTKKLRPDLT